MIDQIAQLRAQLDTCQTLDRRNLMKGIEQLEKRLAKELPSDKLLARLQNDLQASQQAVAEKAASQPQISYPDLPVAEKREDILQALRDNQVVVIAGETGSGKTTQLPKICMELGLGQRGLIGHTQPRRLAARTVANRIADELNSPLGELVGYQVRFHDQVSANSRIKLMTDGILLAETQHDRLLEKYEVIIIDEAHERSLNIDFLLGYLKRILEQRPDLKLIITSATIDLERFSKHFGDAPIIEVSGRTYPVEVLYRPLLAEGEDERDLSMQEGVLSAVEEIEQLDRSAGKAPGDILIFMSGEREIRETAEQLRKAKLRDTEIMPLYARLSLAEQNRVFSSDRRAGRRIVIATNVAETSVTVPGIRYVIDPGLARISRYSYRSKVQRLPIEPVSQASANQRKGRCGRIAEGVCIRLYSEEDFISRPEFTDAEIRRTNLAAVILQMLMLKLGDIRDFPFIDPPDTRFVNDGYTLLQELGAVDEQRRVTQLGRQLSRLPVDPRIGRMVLQAARQDALHEVLVIAAALSVQDPRERPADKKQAADQMHAEFADKESDFMGLLNLWNHYEEQRQELSQNQLRKYCSKRFLSFMRMREWRDVHRQLHLVCKELKLRENSEPAEYEAIHKSLLAGLLSHIGFKQENKEYLGARNRRFQIFPGSDLYKKAPKWIMSAELVETSKLYARMNARIAPEWVEPLAGHLVKRSYLEPHWEKKRAQVVAYEQVTLFGLIVIPKRKIHFGTIEPDTAHEIFIRSALVEGEYQTNAAFFKHNQQLLADVEDLEAKSRRRDLLVDEDTLYDFYADRMAQLKGSGVVNGAGFEKWRKQVEAENPKILFLTEEDVLQRSADHVTARDYPENYALAGAKLKLAYNFEPGKRDDGVTLELPLAMLKTLDTTKLEWLVPGMLYDKCVALLKGLPKQLRKNFVPIPDYAKNCVERMVFGEGDLHEAICHQLKRMTAVTVEPQKLREVELDDHLKTNIRLLDEKGKCIAQGRDWQKLVAKYGEQAEEALKSGPSESWGRKGITCWDFGELPASIQLRQAGGIKVDAYPALTDQGDQLELTVMASQAAAEQASRLGIARLALLNMREQVRFAQKELPKINESLIYTNKLFNTKQLTDEIMLQAGMQALDLDQSLPRTRAEYESKLNKAKERLYPISQQVAEKVFVCHKHFHAIQKRLNGRVDLASVPVLNDVKAQLAALIKPGYLVQTAWPQLEHFPRYLEAIVIRLEKFQRNLPKERLLSEQLQQYWQQYQQKKQQNDQQGLYDPDLEAFRWMLEEYRVSLFAQQLGTQQIVSDKRLRQFWQTL